MGGGAIDEKRIDKYQLFSCEGDPLLPSGGQSIEIQLIASGKM